MPLPPLPPSVAMVCPMCREPARVQRIEYFTSWYEFGLRCDDCDADTILRVRLPTPVTPAPK
jgi:hypothetical protein